MIDTSKLSDLKNKKIKFIVCEVVLDELKDKIPVDWVVVDFEKRLHEHSDNLREKLQAEIDRSRDFDVILFGYGLCGNSLEGLVSKKPVLVIPRCDDCITLFLGSSKEYKRQFKKEPGTYYLTRGYIGEAEDILVNKEIRDKYDQQTWDWIIGEMLKNYTRLAYINTGNYDPSEWRELARKESVKLNLKFEEIKGSGELFNKIISYAWDNDFLVIKPGQKITAEMFLKQNID